jgi:DNA-directed RNA polymerase specialized sigma24 family protein
MDATAKTTARRQARELAEKRVPEGFVRVLEGKFRGARFVDCEEAVAEGFLKFLLKDETLENPAGYIFAVAYNHMRHLLTRKTLDVLPAGELEDEEKHDTWEDPTAEEVVGDDVFRFAREIVGGWESRNVRTATLLVLEAARLGEPISGEELAEALEGALEEQILPSTARQWKKRGLDRLRKQLAEIEDGKEVPTDD